MDNGHDTISHLAAVTQELAEIQDLGGKRLSDLLERRGVLIRQLIAARFDAGDNRLTSIITNAERLQERLQKRAASLRADLSGVRQIGALMTAVESTLSPAESNTLDVRG